MTHTNNPTEQQAELRERLASAIWTVHGENPRDAILNNVIDVFAQELGSLLDSDCGATCICQRADTAVCDHNWSLCNEIRDRVAQLKENQP